MACLPLTMYTIFCLLNDGIKQGFSQLLVAFNMTHLKSYMSHIV